MDVFDFRDRLIHDYTAYTKSFIQIRDERISQTVRDVLDAGALWPRPLIQLNSSFEVGESIYELVAAGVLRQECKRIFRKEKDSPAFHGQGRPLRLHRHQSQATRIAGSVPITGRGANLRFRDYAQKTKKLMNGFYFKDKPT